MTVTGYSRTRPARAGEGAARSGPAREGDGDTRTGPARAEASRTAPRRRRRAVGAAATCVGLAALGLALLGPLPVRAAEPLSSAELAELLERYNSFVRHERCLIETLRVVQTMVDPQEDGSERTAVAELTYIAGSGMVRDVLSSDLAHPEGDYTLDSVIGPELPGGEYDIEPVGRDTVDGESAFHLRVTALDRDRDHFDGEIWISEMDASPVRVRGRVADPPFPVVLITFDKRFERLAPQDVRGEECPTALRLLRRHSGEAEVNLLLGRKRGQRHIFYDDYVVRVRPPDGGPTGSTAD